MNKLVPEYALVANNIYRDPASKLTRGELVRPELPYAPVPGTIDEFLAKGGQLGALAAGSFAINAGTAKEPTAQDIQGKARDAQPDPGAYEF